jgi:hypothetical protein
LASPALFQILLHASGRSGGGAAPPVGVRGGGRPVVLGRRCLTAPQRGRSASLREAWRRPAAPGEAWRRLGQGASSSSQRGLATSSSSRRGSRRPTAAAEAGVVRSNWVKLNLEVSLKGTAAAFLFFSGYFFPGCPLNKILQGDFAEHRCS